MCRLSLQAIQMYVICLAHLHPVHVAKAEFMCTGPIRLRVLPMMLERFPDGLTAGAKKRCCGTSGCCNDQMSTKDFDQRPGVSTRSSKELPSIAAHATRSFELRSIGTAGFTIVSKEIAPATTIWIQYLIFRPFVLVVNNFLLHCLLRNPLNRR